MFTCASISSDKSRSGAPLLPGCEIEYKKKLKIKCWVNSWLVPQGVVKAGLIRAGVAKAGMIMAGVVKAGMVRAGVVMAGVMAKAE